MLRNDDVMEAHGDAPDVPNAVASAADAARSPKRPRADAAEEHPALPLSGPALDSMAAAIAQKMHDLDALRAAELQQAREERDAAVAVRDELRRKLAATEAVREAMRLENEDLVAGIRGLAERAGLLEPAGESGEDDSDDASAIFCPKESMDRDLHPVANETYQFAKAFSEGDHVAAGQMLIPGGAEKPSKNTRANTMVKVTIHNATFVAKRHDQFMVPRGNQYRLYNEEAEECRLFFAHAREVVADQVHE
ncbi:hypothetical protein DFJ74DRAFT_707769 [Hyaloraphidium curvatum]|nr:hypothetical protein DFJ74DRAFT_707769 [Hyaloraphidium curvatum]